MDTMYSSGKKMSENVHKMLQYRNKGAVKGEKCQLCNTKMEVGKKVCPRCKGIREIMPKGFIGFILDTVVTLSMFPILIFIFFILAENMIFIWLGFVAIAGFSIHFMPVEVAYMFPPRDAETSPTPAKTGHTKF